MNVEWDDLDGLSSAAFDDAPVGMALTLLEPDGSRTIHVANRALAELLGTTPAALAGTTFNSLTHPDDLSDDDAGAIQVRNGAVDVYRRRKRYRHSDGHYVWAELHARALRTEHGVTATLAHIIDISERMQLEQTLARHAMDLEREVTERTAELAQSEARLRAALRESQIQHERLEAVLDTSNAAVSDWNVHDGTLHLSESWYRMLGYDPAETDLTTAPLQDHVHPDDWPEMVRLAEQSSRAGDPSLEFTFRVRHKDGTWRWNRHRGVVTEWEDDGRAARILGIDLDVTEQHELEQQLIHAAKMQSLGAFAGGIAHDFNNVLAIIQGHTEALERSTADLPVPNGQRSRIQAIQRSVHRAASLVRNLMLLNRPAVTGHSSVDLADYLRRSAATMPYVLGEDVRLEITVPPRPVIVQIDEGRFEAVVLNLAANARDAMPAGGTLTMALEVLSNERPSAMLRVTDTGIGMDQATLDSAFEPFFTTKAPGVGTGLGLATTYATITEADGTITAASRPGEGTTVTIIVPISAEFDEPEPPPTSSSAPANLGSPAQTTILVVEDEAELLELTTEVLRDCDYRVHAALSAEEALEILERCDDIDLVVTDAVMPGLNGPELAAIIRRRWPSIKILFMSGYAARSPVNDSFADDQFLTKPVGADQLVQAVTRALRSD